MKKTIKIIKLCLFFLSFSIYAQEIGITDKSFLTKDLNKKAVTIFNEKTENNEIICVKEKRKKLSSDALYYFYHYDSNRELVNSYEFKTKQIHKVYLTKDSIYLIRYKKNYLPKLNEGNRSNSLSRIKSIDYYYQSSAINKFDFKEIHWSSLNNKGKHWNTNPYDLEIIFDENNSEKQLLRMSLMNYKPTKEEITLSDLYIKAKDSLERKKHYSLNITLDIFDENLQEIISKNVILTNNIGSFYVEKHKIHSNNNSVYLLLSTYDNKKKKLISTGNKINTKYHLVRISNDTVLYKTIDDNIHSIATMNMDLFEDKIICAGMYSNTNNKKINGFCRLEFDKNTLSKGSQSYLGFTNTFLNDTQAVTSTTSSGQPGKTSSKNSSYNSADNKDYRRFKSLSSDYIDIDKDGNCVINIEESEIIQSGGSMMGMPGMGMPLGGGFSLSFGMNFNNPAKRQNKIIAVKIGSNNQIIWARAIKIKERKKLFYSSTNIDGVNYIIKNDTPRTHKYYSKKAKKDSSRDYLYSISINNEGEINSQRFFPCKGSVDLNFNKGLDNINNKYDLFLDRQEKGYFQILKIGVK